MNGIVQRPNTDLQAVLDAMTSADIPIFRCEVNPMFDPNDEKSKEHFIPWSWQSSVPIKVVIEEGSAVCLLAGHGLDGVDVDTKNGASVEGERAALVNAGVRIVGEVRTPSGGAHFYVISTGTCSSANKSVGVDFRGGSADGSGRGFLFLPGTKRPKYGGTGYEWVQVPDLDSLGTIDRADQRNRLWAYLESKGITPRSSGSTPAEILSGEPVDESVLPAELVARLQQVQVSDRSAHFHGILALCCRANLSQRQAVTLIAPWCAQVGKFTDRVEEEVARSWAKLKTDDTEPTLAEGSLKSVPMGRQMAREHFVGSYIFVSNIGWHRWDGTRWVRSSDDHMRAVAASWAHRFISALVASNEPNHVIKGALRYRDVGQVDQLLKGARTEASVLVNAERLDAQESLLNCSNGILDLRTKTLLPHDPKLLMTKTTGVDFVTDAIHDDWTKALSALSDEETSDWLQCHLGAAATGERDRENPVIFHQGDGANGKTTIIGALVHALGDYAVQVPDKLLSGSGNEHDTLWMPLQGARIAYLEELPEGHQLPVARVKKLAETPMITARLIGKDFVTFPATHTLMVSTNYHPRVTETDHGTWRRLLMVSYPKTFTGSQIDRTLRRRLRQKAQAQAVLSWIAEGAHCWYRENKTLPEPPAAVLASTSDWRDDSDPLATFLAEHITFSDNDADRIPTEFLLARFNEQLKAQGSKQWSVSMFGGRLRAHHQLKEHGCAVNRGKRNLEKTGMTRAIWRSAQGAQGSLGGISSSSHIENLLSDPAHPARADDVRLDMSELEAMLNPSV